MAVVFKIHFIEKIRFAKKGKGRFQVGTPGSDFEIYQRLDWLDSDLIPRLLENFEKWENFMVILLCFKNNPFRRILDA